MSNFTTADKIAAYGGGGLILLGVVGFGLLEMVAGSPHPVDSEGQIVHEALVPLRVRSYIVLLGLAIWAAYAVYKVVATSPGSDSPTILQ
jgi:hypothetical protein